MQLTTIIDIPKSSFKIQPEDKVLFLGSCFADSIGEKFMRGGFDALVNPFGTLYNPMSIAELILRSIDGVEYTESHPDIFQSEDGIWHSWMHHSRFSSSDKETLIHNLNEASAKVREYIKTGNVLVITLGTAIIYRLRENEMLVANCHKQLDSLFIRERLSVNSIVDKWKEVIDKLQKTNDNLKILFTVSPIRHKRDGMHINNISKGILLQSVDEIINSSNNMDVDNNSINNNDNSVHNNVISDDKYVDNSKLITNNSKLAYFPSYEIMLDELRDYRFYADDMIHPSTLAVDYIWERFSNTYFDKKTLEYIRLKNKEWARSQHRTLISPSPCLPQGGGD